MLTSNGARATTHLLCLIKVNSLRWRTNFDPGEKKKNLDHFSICARHPCAGAMLIFSVLFQFYRMSPNRSFSGRAGTYEDIAGFIIFRCGTTQKENNMELQYLSWGPTTCRWGLLLRSDFSLLLLLFALVADILFLFVYLIVVFLSSKQWKKKFSIFLFDFEWTKLKKKIIIK